MMLNGKRWCGSSTKDCFRQKLSQCLEIVFFGMPKDMQWNVTHTMFVSDVTRYDDAHWYCIASVWVSHCLKAYYGGEARCEEGLAVEGGAIGGESFNPSELVCGGCSDVSRAQMCPRHGADYLEYKCRYCCSVAVFFCFGTTHFCNACHEDFRHVTEMPKHALPKCPAGMYLVPTDT